MWNKIVIVKEVLNKQIIMRIIKINTVIGKINNKNKLTKQQSKWYKINTHKLNKRLIKH